MVYWLREEEWNTVTWWITICGGVAEPMELGVQDTMPKIQIPLVVEGELVGSYTQVVTPDLGHGIRWKPPNWRYWTGSTE